MPGATPVPSSAVRPNLVIVFPDEMRAQAMGFLGADPVITPHLDRFAAQGKVLINAASCYPVCSPYRASLLTGKYPYSSGVTFNCNSFATPFGVFLKPTERCLGDVLKDAGYACGYIGKWHLDAPEAPPAPDWRVAVWDAYTPPGPRRHGFDFWYSYGCHNNHLKPFYYVGDRGPEDKIVVDQWSPEHEADVACRFIRNEDGRQRDPSKPFALLVSMNPPHMPYHAMPERYKAMYGTRTSRDLLTRPNVRYEGEGLRAQTSARDYFAAITGVDDQFGRILACLNEQGLDEKTLVIFSSDHGDMMGSQGEMYKSWWYEESFLVPFIIRWTGHLNPGRELLHLAAPDIMPTLLGMMGLGDQVPEGVEGSDYSDVLLGLSSARPTSALYMWPDIRSPTGGARGVRTNRYTFVINRRDEGPRTILFDNRDDPYQMRNIAEEAPALVTELTSELNLWLNKTRDPWAT